MITTTYTCLHCRKSRTFNFRDGHQPRARWRLRCTQKDCRGKMRIHALTKFVGEDGKLIRVTNWGGRVRGRG